MKLEFTPEAVSDLREYLADRSPSGLANMIADIEETIDSILNGVIKGRKTSQKDIWEMLSLRYKFLIPYHMHDNTLYILRVYRANRDSLDYESLQIPPLSQ